MLCVGFVDSEVKCIMYFEKERENVFKEPTPYNFVWYLQNPYFDCSWSDISIWKGVVISEPSRVLEDPWAECLHQSQQNLWGLLHHGEIIGEYIKPLQGTRHMTGASDGGHILYSHQAWRLKGIYECFVSPRTMWLFPCRSLSYLKIHV